MCMVCVAGAADSAEGHLWGEASTHGSRASQTGLLLFISLRKFNIGAYPVELCQISDVYSAKLEY